MSVIHNSDSECSCDSETVIFDRDQYFFNRKFYASCITRIPYATVIAFILNMVGLIVFTLSACRGLSVIKDMLWETFQIPEQWPDLLQMTIITTSGIMTMIGFMILFVGFLATGSTRRRIYRHFHSRVAGRISCAIFLGITYILLLIWMIVFIAVIITTFLFVNLLFLCQDKMVATYKRDIDLSQFQFYFPKHALVSDETFLIRENEIKQFCSVSVQYGNSSFIFSSLGCVIIIISLIHYIICLSANYTHIRSQEKFYEIQELHYLTSDINESFSKDRF